jgi:hypothetical protein
MAIKNLKKKKKNSLSFETSPMKNVALFSSLWWMNKKKAH